MLYLINEFLFSDVPVRMNAVQNEGTTGIHPFMNIKNWKHISYIEGPTLLIRERSGSVVECLTQDQGAAGSSHTGVTALWSLSKTHLSQLSTGSTQEDPSLFN